MATSSKSTIPRACEGLTPRLCPTRCGSMISARDPHSMCITCMGPKHAQRALADPDCCPHCSGMQTKVLERRLRVASTSQDDPSLANAGASNEASRNGSEASASAAPPSSEDKSTASAPKMSWGDVMDVETPLPPLFEDQLLREAVEDFEEEDEESLSPLLQDIEEDDEDAILPSAQVSRPPSAASVAGLPNDFGLIELCRRAATKLVIDWPAPEDEAGASRDLFDGKRLPPRVTPAKQLLPAVPACMAEMKRYWDKPFSHRVPVKGFTQVDVHGMDGLGLSLPPTVEPSVANHLNPSRRTPSTANLSLPGKAERFSASILQKMYKSSGLGVRALNATSLLTAYQAELMDEMGKQLDAGTPNPVVWEEICYITDLNLRTFRGAIQSCGRAMGLAVVGERALWLNLSSLTDKEKADLLDAPIDPKALFGPAIAAMRDKCDARKKEGEAFDVCLPRRPAPQAAPGTRTPAPPPQPPQPRTFQQAARAPRQQQGEQPANPQPRAQGPRSWSRNAFSSASSRPRQNNPHGPKKRRDT